MIAKSLAVTASPSLHGAFRDFRGCHHGDDDSWRSRNSLRLKPADQRLVTGQPDESPPAEETCSLRLPRSGLTI
jgi:hypothetical protein